MGDLSETFKTWQQVKRQKKFLNREQSTKLLDDLGVQFEVKNFGHHLIVHAPEGVIDFWPGTGLWKDRNNGIQRRGVFRMLGFMGIKV